MRFKTPRTSYKSLVGLLLSVSALLAAPDYVEAADTNLAGQLRDNYRIIVEPGPAWDEADLRAIRDGAAAMPGALFDALERPLRLEKRPETCLFAQGRYDKKCPSFSKNGRVFYVYEPGGESPKLVARTMAGLSQAEQRALFCSARSCTRSLPNWTKNLNGPRTRAGKRSTVGRAASR